ncbi:hypothetical protein ACHAXS_005927 [Conticribra weissflogii]
MKINVLRLGFLSALSATAQQAPAVPRDNQFDVCTDFCKSALTVCEGTVDWVTGNVAVPFTRHGQERTGGKRVLGSTYNSKARKLGMPSEQFDACHYTCMGWMYFRQEAQISFEERYFNGYNVGDNLNCRYNHLNFAQGIPRFYFDLQASESEAAAQHCQHITPDGGWVCTDIRDESGMTPSQHLKNSVLRHRLGDCFLAADNTIADCHAKALRDDIVDAALAWLPDDIEYIFLNNNALQRVPNISRFTKLKGIYLENNSIKSLHAASFENNTQIEIINLGNNLIGIDTVPKDGVSVRPDYELPRMLLHKLPNLRLFVLNYNYVSKIPTDFFVRNKNIEVISLLGNSFTEFPESLLRGLTKLELFAFGQQGKNSKLAGGIQEQGKIFTEAGLPDTIFDDCVSLQYWSGFVNGISLVKARWFQNTPNIESIVLFLNGSAADPSKPLVIEPGVFANLPNLIDFSMYSSDYHGTPAGALGPPPLSPGNFLNNHKILGVLDGSQFLLAPKSFRQLVGLGDLEPLGMYPEILPLPFSTA